MSSSIYIFPCVCEQQCHCSCGDPENFVRGGPTLTGGFFDEEWEDPNTTIRVPSWARQQNAISLAFRWRADDGSTLNAGSVAS